MTLSQHSRDVIDLLRRAYPWARYVSRGTGDNAVLTLHERDPDVTHGGLVPTGVHAEIACELLPEIPESVTIKIEAITEDTETMNENQISRIVETIGLSALLEQLAEESAELAQAALKTARVLRDENPTPVTYHDAWEHLVEEIADVTLCIEALNPAKPDDLEPVGDIMLHKFKRWMQRLGDRQELRY